MRTLQKAALATTLGVALALSPGAADARHWRRPWAPPPVVVHRHHMPGVVIGLGIAGAVLGTVALIDSLIPRPVFIAAPPPPPASPYDTGYHRGYRAGRRDADYDRYDDGYRY